MGKKESNRDIRKKVFRYTPEDYASVNYQQIKKIAIPYFLCDCIGDMCKKHNVQIRYYHIGYDFLPVLISERRLLIWYG